MGIVSKLVWIAKEQAANSSGAVVDGKSPVSLYSGMVPNLAFNISMCAIWGVLLTLQTLALWLKQYWFSVAFMCAGVLEVLGYIGRIWSHFNLFLFDPFLLQMVCLTIAPVFTMGGVYYQLAKMIEIYGHKFALLPSPMAYSYIFIGFDIVSLAVQAAGGGVAGTEAAEGNKSDQGDHIFVAGLALQVASMTIFMMLVGHFYYQVFVQTRLDHAKQTKLSLSLFKIKQHEIDYLYRQKFADLRLHPDRWVFHYFPLAIVLTVAVVFVRCCYRLAELVEGWDGNLITHENYFIILDALMMAIATVTLTVFHPGFAFRGRYVSIPITHGRVDPETIEKPPSELDKEGVYPSSGEEEPRGNNKNIKNPFRKLKNPFK